MRHPCRARRTRPRVPSACEVCAGCPSFRALITLQYIAYHFPRRRDMSSSDTSIKNVVLVHGAFADGSGWRRVYDLLTHRGYRVTIVQNPLTSLRRRRRRDQPRPRPAGRPDDPRRPLLGRHRHHRGGYPPERRRPGLRAGLIPDIGRDLWAAVRGLRRHPRLRHRRRRRRLRLPQPRRVPVGLRRRCQRRRRRLHARHPGARSTWPSSPSPSPRPRGTTGRAGRSSRPRTRRSTRRCCSTWQNAPAPRSPP